MAPRIDRILESALYVADVRRSAEFYTLLFGFPRLVYAEERLCALDVAGTQVLLLFRKGATLEPMPGSGGTIPPHHGEGNLHFAFGITADEYEAWKRRLSDLGIAVESEVHWPAGGRSIYFRDPDGHCVELATPGTWKTY